MTGTAPVIVADVHERRSGVPGLLEATGIPVTLHALAVGDYAIGARVVVERKTVRGLHLAVVQGRFWRQLGRLRREAAKAYLLVEGADLDDCPLSSAGVRGVLLTVGDLGVHVLRSVHAADSAAWLARLAARSAGRPRSDRPRYDQLPARRPSEIPEAILAAVPGVSVMTARALLARFGDVRSVVDADQRDLVAVRGVGPARAEAIRAAFRRASSPEAKKVG